MSGSEGDTPQPAPTFDTADWTPPADDATGDGGNTGDAGSPPASASGDEPDASAQPPGGATTPADAGAEPGAGSEPGTDAGPIPLERHQAVLNGEREKFTALDQRFQRIAWTEELVRGGLTKEQANEALRVHANLIHDPAAFLEVFLRNAQSDPELAAQVRDVAGKVLGQQGAPRTDADDAEPKPDLFVDDPKTGHRTYLYSAEQTAKWRAWNDRRTQAGLDKRLGPLEADARRRQRDDAAAERVRANRDRVAAELDQLKQYPEFVENQEAIKAYLKERNWEISLTDAYLHVLHTKVLPGKSDADQAATIADLRKKAAAGKTPAGTATDTATPKDVRRMDDPRLKWKD